MSDTPKPQLVIHIGSHKTGTTSIQNACSRLLRAEGPGAARYINLRPVGTRVVRSKGRLADFRAEIILDAADQVFRPKENERIIISDESFFWISEPDTVHDLAALLRQRFSSVIILCYLRRQDLLAVSHRKQVSEGMPAARFYGLHATPLPQYQPHFQSYFDYAAKLATIWVSAFGKKNVQVVSYDGITQAGGDVVKDFAARAGIALDLTKPIRTNRSMNGDKTLVGLKLTQMGMSTSLRRQILKALPGAGKFRPTRAEAQAFLAYFEQANHQLAQDWTWQGAPFAFDQSFDMYPKNIARRWNDGDVERIIQAIVTGMRSPKGK